MTSIHAVADASVVQAVEAMTAAFHDGNLPGVLGAYAHEATVAFEPGRPVSGEAALSAGFQQFFSVHPRFRYGGHDVMVAGDLALHIAPWAMTGQAPDGKVVAERGLSVAVLRRSAAGAWQLVLDNPFGDRLLRLNLLGG
ncbi:MAG: YybH family protein [Roseateles sp.]|uniref:YybH family protein n=1 Tax=Roseateles sp. TaxID=1971397 RepID=UPI004035033E